MWRSTGLGVAAVARREQGIGVVIMDVRGGSAPDQVVIELAEEVFVSSTGGS